MRIDDSKRLFIGTTNVIGSTDALLHLVSGGPEILLGEMTVLSPTQFLGGIRFYE